MNKVTGGEKQKQKIFLYYKWKTYSVSQSLFTAIVQLKFCTKNSRDVARLLIHKGERKAVQS